MEKANIFTANRTRQYRVESAQFTCIPQNSGTNLPCVGLSDFKKVLYTFLLQSNLSRYGRKYKQQKCNAIFFSTTLSYCVE